MVHLYWCLQVHIIECSQVLKAKYGTPFSAPLHILMKIHRLLIFLCSVNLFWHVKVIQEALLLYRKDGVSINTDHLQRAVKIIDWKKAAFCGGIDVLLTMLKHMPAISQSFLLKNLKTKKGSLDQLPLKKHWREWKILATCAFWTSPCSSSLPFWWSACSPELLFKGTTTPQFSYWPFWKISWQYSSVIFTLPSLFWISASSTSTCNEILYHSSILMVLFVWNYVQCT